MKAEIFLITSARHLCTFPSNKLIVFRFKFSTHVSCTKKVFAISNRPTILSIGLSECYILADWALSKLDHKLFDAAMCDNYQLILQIDCPPYCFPTFICPQQNGHIKKLHQIDYFLFQLCYFLFFLNKKLNTDKKNSLWIKASA